MAVVVVAWVSIQHLFVNHSSPPLMGGPLCENKVLDAEIMNVI